MPKINPYKLLPHPFNTKVYGEEVPDAEFIQSIREKGILEPVIVTSTTIAGVMGLYVLSGHRRTEAAKIVKCDVPYRIEQDQGPLWQESFLLEVNRQRIKTTEQIAREYTELKRIELALAEKRRAQGIREPGSASERAATKLGVQDAWARKAEAVVTAADNGNVAAVQGLAKINGGTLTVESVYRAIQPKEENTTAVHYDGIAKSLQEAVGFFDVSYLPQLSDPKHGFVFKHRFVCEDEARDFIAMIAAIPQEARETFIRQSKSWRK